MDRYHRQILLSQIGQAGQERLSASRVLLVGCGALGSSIAEQLARAGVGFIRIADRDIVELTNLQRQVLFDEEDARQSLPKAIAAANRLRQINSTLTIDPQVVDVDSDNIETLLQPPTPDPRPPAALVDLVLDGTDNVQTRYLLNDACVKHGIPWVYGACVGAEGRVMAICPGGPCLRCVFPQPPDPLQLATCDTAGVLGPVASIVGSLQALAAIKLLSGHGNALADELLSLDLWSNRIRAVSLADAKREDCPACGRRQFQFLESPNRDLTAKLCGRNAVQVRTGATGSAPALAQVARRLQSAGEVRAWAYMVRCTLREGGLTLTVFADGRVIVAGTPDPVRATSVVARYLGS